VNREGAEVTSAGRAFQTRAPATEKARCPTVGSLTVVKNTPFIMIANITNNCFSINSSSAITREMVRFDNDR